MGTVHMKLFSMKKRLTHDRPQMRSESDYNKRDMYAPADSASQLCLNHPWTKKIEKNLKKKLKNDNDKMIEKENGKKEEKTENNSSLLSEL